MLLFSVFSIIPPPPFAIHIQMCIHLQIELLKLTQEKRIDANLLFACKSSNYHLSYHFMFTLNFQRKCREIGGYIIKIDDSKENEKIHASRPESYYYIFRHFIKLFKFFFIDIKLGKSDANFYSNCIRKHTTTEGELIF